MVNAAEVVRAQIEIRMLVSVGIECEAVSADDDETRRVSQVAKHTQRSSFADQPIMLPVEYFSKYSPHHVGEILLQSAGSPWYSMLFQVPSGFRLKKLWDGVRVLVPHDIRDNASLWQTLIL